LAETILGKGGSTLRHLQRELGCKITYSTTSSQGVFTAESVRSDALDVFEGRFNHIVVDPVGFTESLRQLQSKKLHIFVDASNIMFGAQRTGENERDLSIRIKVNKLIETVTNFRHVEHGVVIGTVPDRASKYWEQWRDAGFDVHVFQAVKDGGGRKYEQGVDDTLQTMMSQDAARVFNPSRTLVLMTGDGNQNHGRVSFPEVVENAIRNDWTVEIWRWKASGSKIYKCLHEAYPSRVTLYDLDPFREHITYHKERSTTVPKFRSTDAAASASAEVDNRVKYRVTAGASTTAHGVTQKAVQGHRKSQAASQHSAQANHTSGKDGVRTLDNKNSKGHKR
jgi:hypothetical protein